MPARIWLCARTTRSASIRRAAIGKWNWIFRQDIRCINTILQSSSCVCRNGFSGAHCRLRQHVCLSNQSAELCGSHGTCLPANSAAGYVCICEPGWTWADTNVSSASASPCTRDVNECAPDVNPCHDECINLPGSFRCGACPPGYTGEAGTMMVCLLADSFI